MRLCFDSADIERWADFSGDRNPIHFDPQAAARLGAADVVVHGMLVLLPVKQHLSQLISAGADDWLQFKAMLRTPVPRGSGLQLAVRDRTIRTSFRLASDDGDSEHMLGDIRRIAPPTWESSAPEHVIDAAAVAEQLDSFRTSFGTGCPCWIGLDAIVFGDFISRRIGQVLADTGVASGPASGNGDAPRIEDITEHVLIQISHRTAFSADIAHIDSGRVGEIRYQVDHASITHEPGGAFGTLDLGVTVDGTHLMTIELGLMTRKQSTTPRRTMS